MFSFIAGFAVFAALGHLSYLEGIPVKDLPFAGFSLVFGTWPVVFGTLPGGEHWVRLLFFDLFLLGIDSGFGLLEGALTAAADTVYLSHFSKAQLAGIMSIVGFLFSIIYCTDAGLSFLDVVDWYINFVMLFVGFLEAFAAGWIFGIEEQIKACGMKAVGCYFAANFLSVIVACIVWFASPIDVSIGTPSNKRDEPVYFCALVFSRLYLLDVNRMPSGAVLSPCSWYTSPLLAPHCSSSSSAWTPSPTCGRGRALSTNSASATSWSSASSSPALLVSFPAFGPS